MVRLESQQKGVSPSIPLTFTFQYGQIRKLFISYDHPKVIINLHSSMVRLERQENFLFLILQKHLHSSMVRLERAILVEHRGGSIDIYIPVWLDQKVLPKCYQYLNIIYIYIPVWLDQKVDANTLYSFVTQIYIPVWLDQKAVQLLFMLVVT